MPEISTRPITPAQVKAIHVALHRRDIDDEAYRALLEARYGVTTCKALTRRQAGDLLTRLGRALPRPPGSGPAPTARRKAAQAMQAPSPPPKAGRGVVRLVTPLQRVFIDELVAEIKWREEDGYERWLRRSMGMERVATTAQARKVIEGLRAMRRRGGVG